MGHPDASPPLSLSLNAEALAPLVTEIVRAVLAELEQARALVPDNVLALTEPAAAAALSLQAHQLRDLRLRGEILASVGPGRKILYTRETLVNFLASRRWQANGHTTRTTPGRQGRDDR